MINGRKMTNINSSRTTAPGPLCLLYTEGTFKCVLNSNRAGEQRLMQLILSWANKHDNILQHHASGRCGLGPMVTPTTTTNTQSAKLDGQE